MKKPSEVDIRCSAETIFDLITDFRGQDRWLAQSSAFHGTSDVSANPVTLGTTYRGRGPFGVRNGTVIDCERAKKISFHQPMTLKLRCGTIDVTGRYTLTPGPVSTHVQRVVTVNIPSALRPFRSVVAREFRVESGHTLIALKAYADKVPRAIGS